MQYCIAIGNDTDPGTKFEKIFVDTSKFNALQKDYLRLGAAIDCPWDTEKWVALWNIYDPYGIREK